MKLGSEGVVGDGEGWLVVDGAHTAQSAVAMASSIRQIFPDNPVALIVAMADDKDHKAVMTALRSGLRPALVIFTSVDIAGSSQRSVTFYTMSCMLQCAMTVVSELTCAETFGGEGAC